jgi:hypothetical protein
MARPRIKLTDGEIAQAQEMLKAGKDVDEVVDFMKQTYDVAADPKFIKKLKKGLDGGDAAPTGKRKYTRRAVSGKTSGRKAVVEVADDPGCVLVSICVHAKICTPEICKFRKA